jgi:phytoene synthase
MFFLSTRNRHAAIRMPVPSPAQAPELAADFELCNRVTRTHSKSFHLSTAFLPQTKREAIRALYAFCRTTDDIVDAPGTTCFQGDIHAWRAQSRKPWQHQIDPVLRAWAWVREQYQVPAQYAEELIDGCESDLRVQRYETWEQLRRYCYLVASTVGLISMYIIGARDGSAHTLELARKDAIDLGVALQLTNVLRDVGEDYERGRVYLPQEDLARFNLTDADLEQQQVDDRFRHLMRFEMDRADALYDSSWHGIRHLRADGRLAVGAASLLYRGILGQIAANGYDVFTRRAHLTARQKIAQLPGIYMQVRALG